MRFGSGRQRFTHSPTERPKFHLTPNRYANGDHAQYLDHVFRMGWVDGEPFPADDESLDARWFDCAKVTHMSAPRALSP